MDKETKQKYNSEYYSNNRKKILKQKQEYQKDNREKLNLKNRKFYHENDAYRNKRIEKMKIYKRNWRLQNVYKMSEEDYNEMLKSQDNLCIICRKEWGGKGIPHIDHDHKTGKVRGLLCQKCNQGLGMFCDDPNLLQCAAGYLLDKSNTGEEDLESSQN